MDDFPYNADNYGGTWGTPPIYDCVVSSAWETINVVGGAAVPGAGTTAAKYIENITGLQGANINVSVSARGDALTGTVFFYINITGIPNGTATIYFKVHNDG